jgi:hypothetical protein
MKGFLFQIKKKIKRMNTKVIVTADENGNVIGVSKNNPEFGYIRVEQTAPMVTDRGWLKISKRSSLIKGKVEDLQILNYVPGQQLAGSIVVKESLQPFNTENPDRDLKIAGDTGVVCRIDDQPIYRQTFYTTNPNAVDELITHDNAEEIRDVQSAQRAMTTIKRNISGKTENVEL